MAQRTSLTASSAHCKQFVKYECYNSVLLYNGDMYGWWVSRDGELILLITNAHAVWIIHVRSLTTDATATWVTAHGKRTAACSKTNPCCPVNNLGIEMSFIIVTRDTTHLWNSIVLDSFKTHTQNCNCILAICRLGFKANSCLNNCFVHIVSCDRNRRNNFDISENHPNFDIYRMRSRLLYILIGVKGLSSTHGREDEWRRKKRKAPSGSLHLRRFFRFPPLSHNLWDWLYLFFPSINFSDSLIQRE